MRFTKGMFEAHRASVVSSGALKFAGGLPLPKPGHGFDSTFGPELFGADWPDPEAAGHEETRQALKIVVVLAFTRALPDLRFDREWLAIQHQSGGQMCHQLSMIGTRLRPCAPIAEALLSIARDRYDEDSGWAGRNLRASQIVRYSAALNAVGLDCELSWRFLDEARYPIDATQRNLDRLAEDASDLRAIADRKGHEPRTFASEPVILVLTENSD